MKKSIRHAYICAVGLTTTICLWGAFYCMNRHESVSISFDTSNRFEQIKTAVASVPEYVDSATDMLMDMTDFLVNLTEF